LMPAAIMVLPVLAYVSPRTVKDAAPKVTGKALASRSVTRFAAGRPMKSEDGW